MDFDLYDDLLVGEAEPTEKEKLLTEENEVLKKEKLVMEERLKILTESNSKLTKKTEILQKNISSLLKTARTEINRKHETIATLKREMDNLILRRSLKMGTRKEYEEVFATLNEAFTKCGDYNKVLPVPGGEENVETPKDRKNQKDRKETSKKRKREDKSTSETPPSKKTSSKKCSDETSSEKVEVSRSKVVDKVSNSNESSRLTTSSTSGTSGIGCKDLKASETARVSNSAEKDSRTFSKELEEVRGRDSRRKETSKTDPNLAANSGVSSNPDASARGREIPDSPAKCTRSNSRLAETRSENDMSKKVVSENDISKKVVSENNIAKNDVSEKDFLKGGVSKRETLKKVVSQKEVSQNVVSKNVTEKVTSGKDLSKTVVSGKVVPNKSVEENKDSSAETDLRSKRDDNSATRHLDRRSRSRDSDSKRKECRNVLGAVRSRELEEETRVASDIKSVRPRESDGKIRVAADANRVRSKKSEEEIRVFSDANRVRSRESDRRKTKDASDFGRSRAGSRELDKSSKNDINTSSKLETNKNSKLEVEKSSKLDIENSSKNPLDKNQLDKSSKLEIEKSSKNQLDKSSKLEVENSCKEAREQTDEEEGKKLKRKLSRNEEVRRSAQESESDQKSRIRSKSVEEKEQRSKAEHQLEGRSKDRDGHLERTSKDRDSRPKKHEEKRSKTDDHKSSNYRDNSRSRGRRRDRSKDRRGETERKTDRQRDSRRHDRSSDRDVYKSRPESKIKSGERKENDLRTKLLSNGSESRQERRREEERRSSSKEDKKKEGRQTENTSFDAKKTSSKTNSEISNSNLPSKIKSSSTNVDSECEEGEITSSDEDEGPQVDPRKVGSSPDLKNKDPFIHKPVDSSNKKPVETGSNLLSRKADPQSTKSSIEKPSEPNPVRPSKENSRRMTKEEEKRSNSDCQKNKPVAEKLDRHSTRCNFLNEKPKCEEISTKEVANSEQSFSATDLNEKTSNQTEENSNKLSVSEKSSQNVSNMEVEKEETNKETERPGFQHSENATESTAEKQIISDTKTEEVVQNSGLEISNPVSQRSPEHQSAERMPVSQLEISECESAVFEPEKSKPVLVRSSEPTDSAKQMTSQKRNSDSAVSEPVKKIAKNLKKIGSFSSEDSLGGFDTDPKAAELPEDLTNVDTVDLESLIEAKRDLMRQLEEKQSKYLKKMKRSRQNSVFEEIGGQDVEQPMIVPVFEESGLKIRISLPSSRRVSRNEPEYPEEPNFSFKPIQEEAVQTSDDSANLTTLGAMTSTSAISGLQFGSMSYSKKNSPVTHWSMTNQKRLAPASDSELTSPEVQTPFGTMSSFGAMSSIKKESPVTRWSMTNQKRLAKTSDKTDSPRSEKSSPSEVPSAWKLGSNLTLPPSLKTPQHEQLFNSPAAGGDCSPEISTVQWGVTGVQNLFSDSWNATPSPSGTRNSKQVDFASTAGIASILKGELVTSGYISPGSGIIRTPTPTHMKTKLYTEPYSGVTPRRSTRSKLVLTPSSESRKSLPDDEDKTPERKTKKVKNKKELFKSLGLEDSSSCSNFGTNSPKIKNIGNEKEKEKPVYSFLPANQSGQKPREDSSSKSKEISKDTTRSEKSNDDDLAKLISKDDGSSSAEEQQQGFKRILKFSPEQQKRRDRKTDLPSAVRNLKSPKDFVSKKTFPASSNRSTGLSLSDQILASYGLSESHSLKPIRDSTSKSGLKTIGEVLRKREESKSSEIATGDSSSKSGFKSEAKSVRDSSETKQGSKSDFRAQSKSEKSHQTLLASCGLEDSPVKKIPECDRPKVQISSSGCGLDDSPVKNSETRSSTQNPSKCQIEKVAVNEKKETSSRRHKKPRLTMTTQSLASFIPEKEEEKSDRKQFSSGNPQSPKEYDEGNKIREEENGKVSLVSNKQVAVGQKENQELLHETIQSGSEISAPSSQNLTTIVDADASKLTPSTSSVKSSATSNVTTLLVGSQSEIPANNSASSAATSSGVTSNATTSSGTTSVEKKPSKRKRVCLSFSTKILASCRPDDNESSAVDLNVMKTENMSSLKERNVTKSTSFDDTTTAQNKNLASSLDNNDVANVDQIKNSFIQTSSSRLLTPQKNLATSLGLDLSSSSEDDDDDLPKTRKSPRKKTPRKQFDKEEEKDVNVVNVDKVVQPLPKKKKKVQLGLSTKENRVDFVFRN